MDGFDPDTAAAPYEIRGNEGPGGAPALPLIFASPHSGRIYPAPMMAASVLDATSIRASEDAFVDALVAGGAAVGAAVIANRFARAYVDVNREPYELDPAMFEDALPAYATARGPRVAAGLGSVPRIVADGQEIYGRKLAFAEAAARIEAVHAPYHAALTALVEATRARHGRAVQPIDLQGGPVRIGPLADLPGIAAYLFRALSIAFVIAVLFWTVTAVQRRQCDFVTRAGIVIVMWAASIMTAAGVHTLDVWRYLVPAVPMVGIMLSLFAVELAETIGCLRSADRTQIRPGGSGLDLS